MQEELTLPAAEGASQGAGQKDTEHHAEGDAGR